MVKTCVLITAFATVGTVGVVYAVHERNKRLEQEADERNQALFDRIHQEQDEKES